jgi:hypothetical protein
MWAGRVKKVLASLNFFLTKPSKFLYLKEEQFWFPSKSWTFVSSKRGPQGLWLVGCVS